MPLARSRSWEVGGQGRYEKGEEVEEVEEVEEAEESWWQAGTVVERFVACRFSLSVQ